MVPGERPARALAGRLVSLDVFRGLTMAAMVIVNNPGTWDHVYWPLEHAPWHGCTPTDLIFPFFLFIVGVSTTLSRQHAGAGTIAWRAAKLVALGLFLSGFPLFVVAKWRIPGVLQRIGVCYLAAALMFRAAAGMNRRSADDMMVRRRLIAVAGVLLVGTWLAFVLLPGATGQRFDLEPETNIGAIADRAVFGTHLWKQTWDPEGLGGTLPSIATTLVGVVLGLWLRDDDRTRVAKRLAAAGAALAVAGLAWSLVLPLNKSLWTSSYAVFTSGAAALVFAACYWLLDVKGWRRWAQPFVVLGVNAIGLFVFSAIGVRLLLFFKVSGPDGRPMAVQTWLYESFFAPLASPVNASLLYAIANLVVLYGVLWVMWRRGVFLKV